MNPEEKKPLTEAELQIQKLIDLKKEKEEKIKIGSDEPAETLFEAPAPILKTVKTGDKAVKKRKNTVKLENGAYRKLSEAAKRLNMSIAGKKMSRDKLASVVIDRIFRDEALLNGSTTKEMLSERIKKLKITETCDE